MHRRTVILAAAAALGSGCSGLKKKDQASRLDQSLSAYTDAIRWGNFGTAAGFAVPRSGSAPPVDPGDLEGLKVTGYSVRINRVNDGADEADVTIAFTYYHESRGTLRQVDQVATWYFHPDRGAWLLDGGLPAFQR